jgi:transcription elongation factor Elf1
MENIKRYDMEMKPKKEKFYLTPLAYLLSFPTIWRRHLKVNKVNMKGLKAPYILLCTHHAFIDFKVTTRAIFPNRATYIVAIDGFIKREKLLRNVGGICKRKFTNDPLLFRHIKYSLENIKQTCAIYPEARYSLCGTTAILPESLGKMVKVLKKPVVVLNMHGNYLTQPVWNLTMRKVPLKADMTQIITEEETHTLSVDEMNERIQKAFIYDEYKWQKENHIKIDYKHRAKGLHQVLYQCPSCKVEHEMDSDLNKIWCGSCGKTYEMDVYGQLKATSGVTEFPHIPDWYEFERSEVRKQIENKTYQFEDEVIIDSLPNSDGYIRLGKGKLIHDLNGFRLEGPNLYLVKEPLSLYGLHIEYNYFGKGDCIDLSTLEDTYYIYPQTQKNVVTKLHFATEELYKIKKQEQDLLK